MVVKRLVELSESESIFMVVIFVWGVLKGVW